MLVLVLVLVLALGQVRVQELALVLVLVPPRPQEQRVATAEPSAVPVCAPWSATTMRRIARWSTRGIVCNFLLGGWTTPCRQAASRCCAWSCGYLVLGPTASQSRLAGLPQLMAVRRLHPCAPR